MFQSFDYRLAGQVPGQNRQARQIVMLLLPQLLQHRATQAFGLNAELPFLHTAGELLHPLLFGLKFDSEHAHAAGTEGPGTIGGGNAVTVTVTVIAGGGG